MHRSVPAVTALGLGLALTLSGCFGNPLEQLTDDLIGGGVEQIIEDQTGVDVDIDGSGASLPDNWPSDVPAVDGTVNFSASLSGTFNAAITVANSADAERAFTDMLDAGYTEVSAIDLGEGGDTRIYENANWTVGVTVTKNTDGTAGVMYNVTPRS